MRALSAGELLSVWEQGLAQPAAQRALMLLTAAYPEATPETLAHLSIGQRDHRLLQLRESTFGSQLVSVANCPVCGDYLELVFTVAELQLPHPNNVPSENTPLTLEMGGYEAHFRLPDSLDLAAAADCEDAAAARHLLLTRCLVSASREGEEVDIDQLPEDVIQAMVTRMAQTDPQADVRLALSCPACGHEWEMLFDIVSFFWKEIDAWAVRALHEVHALASAYGWDEADILAMSPARRRFYLEMIGV
ncbi:MAG: phage baseplate protein [Anaerolineae bacterium]|jgi:hypothetical protein